MALAYHKVESVQRFSLKTRKGLRLPTRHAKLYHLPFTTLSVCIAPCHPFPLLGHLAVTQVVCLQVEYSTVAAGEPAILPGEHFICSQCLWGASLC
jgi:hypothetical protein